MSKATAPTTEIGYAQAPNYNWWLYDVETTPELIWPMSVYVYDQMRRTDAQVTSVLRAMMLPVRSTPWRIDPNGAKDEVVEFVADNLGLPVVGEESRPPKRQKDRFSWAEHLRQALLMLPFGHMYFEQLYRVDKGGKRAQLRKLAPRMPRTIERIDVAEDGGLISIKQFWTRTNSTPQSIPVDRLVAYIHEREGGNWLGSSILRPGYKNWLLKDRLLRVQAQTIERNGMGIPLYKGQEDASAADLAVGLAMAKAWRGGEAAGSAVPFGADLSLVGVSGTLPDAEPAIRYHDEQLGRAVLAHFLNLGTQTGSWALGTTFADFFTLSLQTLTQQVADVANDHIVEDIVDVNWGEDEPAPKIVFDEIGSRQAATAQSLVSLFGAGALTPDARLEESLRQQYGLPPLEPETARGENAINIPGSPAAEAPPEPEPAPGPPADTEWVAASGEVDEDAFRVAALIQALAEFTGELHAKAGPDFNDLHPRGPGGKFRETVDRIINRLGAWSKGLGAGDPLPESEFDRADLRAAALHFGIKVKPGEKRENIYDAILADVRTKTGTTRQLVAPRPDKFTLQKAPHAGKDVVVRRNAKSDAVALFEETDGGRTAKNPLERFDSVHDLRDWADERGESQVADWARAEAEGRPRPDVREAAPSGGRPSSMAAVRRELDGLSMADKVKKVRAWGFSADEAEELTGTPRPTKTVYRDHTLSPEAVEKAVKAAKAAKAAPAKKAAPKRAPFSVGEPISARDKRRLGAVEEADQPRVRDRAQELYGPDKTRAAAWMQALNEHEASKPAKKAAPAKAAKTATPAKRAPRPLNEQEQALLDQIATFSFHNSVITRPERKPTVNRQLDRLIAHGYLREENGQLHITDDGRRTAGQAPRSAPAKAAPVRRLTAAQKVARSEKSRTQRPPGYPERESVPAGKASWSSSYPGYDPPVYTAQSVLDNDSTVKPGGWADPADVSLVDHDFASYEGTAKLDAEGRPLNPYTRTGIQDRGLLGKWGANFAADPIVTRINPDTGRLEMATIQRGEPIDGVHQWAIPGGMVDEGESVSVTLGREFREETGADLDLSTGREIYKGYVDDPRNTDNAWMETTAVHRHLSADEAAAVKFKGPDDPGEIRDIRWAPVDADFMAGLYASHGDFVAEAVRGLLADDSTDLAPDARRSLEAALARPSAKKATPRAPKVDTAAPPAKKSKPSSGPTRDQRIAVADAFGLNREQREEFADSDVALIQDWIRANPPRPPSAPRAKARARRPSGVDGARRDLADRLAEEHDGQGDAILSWDLWASEGDPTRLRQLADGYDKGAAERDRQARDAKAVADRAEELAGAEDAPAFAAKPAWWSTTVPTGREEAARLATEAAQLRRQAGVLRDAADESDRLAAPPAKAVRKGVPRKAAKATPSPLSTERPNPDGLDSTGAQPDDLDDYITSGLADVAREHGLSVPASPTEKDRADILTKLRGAGIRKYPEDPARTPEQEADWAASQARERDAEVKVLRHAERTGRVALLAPQTGRARQHNARLDMLRRQGLVKREGDGYVLTAAGRAHVAGLDSIDEPARPAKVAKVADGLDDMPEHRLRSWAQEFEIPGSRTKSPATLKRELRKQGIGGPEVEQAKRRAEIDAESEAEKLAQMRNPWNGPPSSGSGVGRDVGIYTWEAVDPAYKAAPEDAVFDVPDSEVRQAVEDAWFELTGGRDGKWAKLADLREKIGPKYPFEQVNRVLLHLSREPGSDLIGELMQQHLTTRDRDARVNIGNQPRHMLMFEADKAKRIRAEHDAARPAPEAAARTRQSSIDSARRVADTLAEIAELQDSGASPAAIEARINGQRGRGLPDADADRLVAAVQGGGRSHLRTTEPPVTSSSTPIVPTPTPPNPQSAWGKIRDDPRWAWSSVHGRMGNLDQIDRVYTAPTTEDARRFLDSMGDGRLQDVADHVEDVINVRGLTAERDRDALIDRLVTGIREPESGGDVAQVQADLARDHNLSPTSTVGETSFFNPATMTMAGSPPVEGSGTQVRVVRPGYSVVVDGETVQLSKAVVEVVPAVPRKAASKRPPLDLDAVSTRLAAAPDEASIVMALDGLLMPELRKVAREFNMGLPSDLVKEEGSAPYLVPKRLTADELRQYIAKAMIEGRSKFKWR